MATRRSSKSRRVNDPQGLRGRLLDAAASAFQSRGYNATTMHDVVAAAGATGGATYHHFATKKALGLAVVRERVAKEVDETWIQPIRTAKSTADGVLTVFARVIAELEVRGTVAGCPVNNLALELSLADPDFRDAVTPCSSIGASRSRTGSEPNRPREPSKRPTHTSWRRSSSRATQARWRSPKPSRRRRRSKHVPCS